MHLAPLVAALFAGTLLATAAQAGPLIELSAEASRPAANDLLRASVYGESSGSNPAELARKIEEVLMWRPAQEPGSPLEGTPDDPRFKYLKYD